MGVRILRIQKSDARAQTVGDAAANGCPYPLSLRDISLYNRESPDVPRNPEL